MTTAVCFKCGEFKFGAWTLCSKCQAFPETEDDFVISLAMSDHYFDEATLRKMGESVKSGHLPKLDEKTREAMTQQLRAAAGVGQFDKMAARIRSNIEARIKHDRDTGHLS